MARSLVTRSRLRPIKINLFSKKNLRWNSWPVFYADKMCFNVANAQIVHGKVLTQYYRYAILRVIVPNCEYCQFPSSSVEAHLLQAPSSFSYTLDWYFLGMFLIAQIQVGAWWTNHADDLQYLNWGERCIPSSKYSGPWRNAISLSSDDL